MFDSSQRADFLQSVRMHVTKGLQKLRTCCKECIPPDAVPVDDVYLKSYQYLSINMAKQRTFIANTLMYTSGKDGADAYSSQLPHRHTLCRSCFLAYHSITRSKFYRIRGLVNKGQADFEVHGNCKSASGRVRPSVQVPPQESPTVAPIVAWLDGYARDNGDHMPDKQNEIHLPDYKWSHVHAKMVTRFTLSKQGHKPCSYQYFKKIVRALFKNTKIRKYKRFAKCSECSNLDTLIQRTMAAARASWIRKKDEHIEWQARERGKYEKHKGKAIKPDTRHVNILLATPVLLCLCFYFLLLFRSACASRLTVWTTANCNLRRWQEKTRPRAV